MCRKRHLPDERKTYVHMRTRMRRPARLDASASGLPPPKQTVLLPLLDQRKWAAPEAVALEIDASSALTAKQRETLISLLQKVYR